MHNLNLETGFEGHIAKFGMCLLHPKLPMRLLVF